ncbi:HprK-related kinase A [Kordiimonas sp.]|uniref:HprK-related kinase A n=1 Tax=Kordiimonas sp. TaxID=1970157 RepID=UPI003A8F355F
MSLIRLGDLNRDKLATALKDGSLNLHLGPFVTSLKSRSSLVANFLMDTYRDCPVSLNRDELVDYVLSVGPPNTLRRFIKPQVLPDPGFYFPAIPLPARMAPLALEMGMNLSAALQCFRFTMFHAGVVAKDDKAIMIAANSGGGKSTLTAVLMERGFRLLSDEFAVLGREVPELMPYPRPVSLKKASVDIVRAFAGGEAVSPALQGTPKGTVAYRRARASDIAAMARPAMPKLLVFPKFEERAVASREPVEQADALMRLIAGSPNYQVIGEDAFRSTMRMMQGLKAFELTYGNTDDSIRLVEELWAEVTP